jgi:acyl carrier protein
MPTVEEQIRKFIAENILYSKEGFPYPDETSFLENGIVDSMNVMEIVMYAEETFGIDVKDEEIVPANFDSVRSLANFVRRKGVPAA